MGRLLLFFDGIGVGTDDPAVNPFAAIGAARLQALTGGEAADGACFRALDATLGVPGLPQSATGQTTLLTGINAARHLGRHQTGLPGPSLWPLLERESLFVKLVRRGARATFANAYTRPHLDPRRPRWSASTRAVMASGLPFRMLDDEGRRGLALSHDYTGAWMRQRGFETPARTAEEAASILCALTDEHDFVLYEYFLTDLVAHRGDWAQKLDQARRVEALVDAVLSRIDRERHCVLVTSDHGNLEDGTHSQHTTNPVPLVGWGAEADRLVTSIDGLAGVTPAIVQSLPRD